MILCTGILAGSISSCKKAPQERDYLSNKAGFEQVDTYSPVLGRTFLYKTNFQADGSSFPLLFTLQNLRHADGTPAPELTQNVTVKEWVKDYDGAEKTYQEIEDKRKTVQHPFFEIRPGAGDFIFRQTTSAQIRAYPDSGYLFDVKVQNKGNELLFTKLRLQPLQEVPYEPYEYDYATRQRKTETRTDVRGNNYNAPFSIHPNLVNVNVSKDTLMADSAAVVYFRKTGNGHSLTFKFYDQDSMPIDPLKLNATKWDVLLHGFDAQFTKTQVTYNVAYPIPLTSLDTKYAVAGNANVTFGYTRKGTGGFRNTSSFGLSFAIWQEGDWEMIFRFYRTPRFQDE
ncbi:DUF5007 domain-containing protein [Chitinophaga niastensis]|uniref:DUF5007 domain-containing protein n=1 Tax=Chitinophaga niastensis TaxID=536980 RepID=UPI001304E85E|nr:DUF5007 domain-containing protein [Chitinophaga niastensis]